jgi:hypothetical protein
MASAARIGMLIRTAGLIVVSVVTAAQAADEPSTPSFNRDIRPILSENCWQCHGPDKSQRKARLRLDRAEDATADRGGYRAIEPGHPEQSELIRRITSQDEKRRMPPRATGRQLTGGQIRLLRQWVEQGAKWEKHWAFLPPRIGPIPAVKHKDWCRNPIDYFILDRLEQKGLVPSPEAERTTLIRRVTLDLTGLPPSPAEVDAFLADRSEQAYEKVVDRLLKSPRFGERMAAPWLDAARYADTNGYQTDGERSMWRWRDWVIEAFNNNMPFDQFTLAQIAGDMLPDPTLEQRIATGFNRNHRGNSEGGVIPEEYAVEYVVDRVDTTFTVWLGLTVGCARCHDHKYDPITQKEFYQIFAYFNNVPERGKAIKYGNSPPFIKAPTRDQCRQLDELAARIKAAESHWAELAPDLERAQKTWERSVAVKKRSWWTLDDGLRARFPLDGNIRNTISANSHAKVENGSLLFDRGKIDRAARFDGTSFINAGNVAEFGFFNRFSVAAWIYPTGDPGGTIMSRMVDVEQAEGYSVALQGGKLHVNLIKRWLDDAIRVETVAPLATNQWHHVLVTYDGTRLASGIKVYVDGRAQKIKVNLDDINQSFKTSEPFRIGRGGGPSSGFHGLIDDVRIYDRALPPEEAALVSVPDSIENLASLPPEKRTSGAAYKLRRCFLAQAAPAYLKSAFRNLRDLHKQLAKLDGEIPTTMVMEEMKTPRPTHLLIRGEYDKKGPQVLPGVPASLPPLPMDVPNNRLGFARWLIHPSNPLAARVAVNRFWQMYFGSGLVKTVEDFGSQGEWPSHPELLDWLAVEFMRTGWNIKAMQRLIVTSAAYRQSSRVTSELLHKDPENRLLTRGPRLRLTAEMLRDQALFISGLLVEKLGGPSVKPYQPAGLWKELADETYQQDHGEKLYRRSLYTFWKRTIPPPAMIAFDAAGRETCVVRHGRTNTPLQALNLMNDVTYAEAARVLAQRMMLHGGATPEARLAFAFRAATARWPSSAEAKILKDDFCYHLDRFARAPNAAHELVHSGEAPRPAGLDVRELAAYTAVAGLILNLDEVLTKE